MKTKIIQITAGKGPTECQMVVAKVQKIFLDEAKEKGVEYSILSRKAGTENGALQSVIIQLKSKNLNEFLKDWVGTIQWIGKSPQREFNKRKNWFIGIFELENIPELELDEKEVEFQTFRSSGTGGQHVNKVSTAVRVVHKPTGISATSSESRSQFQNRKSAMEKLRNSFVEIQLEKIANQAENAWFQHQNLERGNPVRIFKGSNFKPKKEKSKTFKNQRLTLKNNLKNDLNKI